MPEPSRTCLAMSRLGRSLTSVVVILAGALVAPGRSYQYDAAGRLILAVYDDGTALRYTYTFGDNVYSVTRLRLPRAPAGLVAERTDPQTAFLAWTDRSSDEAGFLVMRRPAGSSAWTPVATLPPDTLAYTDRGLSAGMNYVYRLAALAGAGAGGDGLRSAYTAEVAAGGTGSVPFYITAFRPLSDSGAGPFAITFEGSAPTTYQLEVSDTLETGSWRPEPWSAQPGQAASLAPIPGLDGPVTVYVEVPASASARYYRVRGNTS